jgi:hypothetical protein
MVDERTKKRREDDRPKPQKRSDYDRTLDKAVKAKKAGKGVPQLGQQEKQSIPDLVVRNEFGSNNKLWDILESMKLPTGIDFDFGELAQECAKVGIDIVDYLEPAQVVDIWHKYEHGRSLWNPDKYKDMGTRMYELNQWYLDACKRNEDYIMLKIRDEHWGRGDDLIHINFAELHQLCHMNSLDKSLISCFCL